MASKKWADVPYQHLLQNEYEKVSDFYEVLLEDEPETLSHYWYLGLAYLLQEKEDQAQLTWFIALNEQKEADFLQCNQALIAILDQEADRQESLEDYQKSWLIRGHIRELEPDRLSNLLKLIYLDTTLQNQFLIKFEDWQIIELLVSQKSINVPDELLIKSLKAVLFYPATESVNFARACLTHSQASGVIIDNICLTAEKLHYEHHQTIFAIDLLKVCLEKQPNNLSLIHKLFWFYESIHQYEDALATAFDFLAKSTSSTCKAVGNCQLLRTYLFQSDWSNVLVAARQHIDFLADLSNQENFYIESYLKDSLIVLPQLLLYIQDNLVENRILINKVGNIFQQQVNLDSHLELSYSNSTTLDRPLKIGYVGHTFRTHSVGWLSRWLIHHHDPEKIDVYIYSVTQNIDELTEEWFIKKAKQFYVSERNIKKVLQKIQEDQIDILVDLDSFTLNLTCQIMALKPAPIQISWLGMDSAGIPAIDYFIADPYVLPDDAQKYYSEKIWRLPYTYLGIDGFEVGFPTLRREDLSIPTEAVIFMNFQNALKRHPDTIRLQLRILKEVPNSYLLIKGSGDESTVKTFFKELAMEECVNFDRLRFLDKCKTELEHRANLQLADVVLDTYPYNGATTTLEVLWSGIPLVTKVGQQFAARNSYTFMVNAGITEGIAWTDEEYIEWGIKLGTDPELRQQISWKLKQSRKISPLWNGKQFARDMENAYRQMWEIYVRENQS